ncbi:L-Aspartase-like protein [Thermothelomyces heterothallicus CBS 202.75]|uniref:L-Aspartase-like protein n=1 Tax=Thermothelomyces heterothallicus CBS 202.75 TaxID=1149848 RepID=UPI003744715C
MLICCNSLMRGHSGVRISVIESVMKLLALDMMIPVVSLRGSISASGDLSTLSYIAGAIEGNPDIFVRVGSSSSSEDGKRRILSARETLKLTKLNPLRSGLPGQAEMAACALDAAELVARVGAVVRDVVGRCFFDGGGGSRGSQDEEGKEEEEEEEEEEDKEAIVEAVKTAVLGLLVAAECGASSVEGLREYQARMAAALGVPASRVVYDFVHKDLRIPLSRGVEDRPPLLLRKAEEAKKRGSNGSAPNGSGAHGEDVTSSIEQELAVRGRTIGTMAGEIYEALGRGELHNRIMKFGKESGIWGI